MGEEGRNVRIVREIVEEVVELGDEQGAAAAAGAGAQALPRIPVMHVTPYTPEPQPPLGGSPPLLPQNEELVEEVANHVEHALQNLDNARNLMEIAAGQQRPVGQGLPQRARERPVANISPYVPEPQPESPQTPQTPPSPMSTIFSSPESPVSPYWSPPSPQSPVSPYGPPPSPQSPVLPYYGPPPSPQSPVLPYFGPPPSPQSPPHMYMFDVEYSPADEEEEQFQPVGRRDTYSIDRPVPMGAATPDRRLTFDVPTPRGRTVDRRQTYSVQPPARAPRSRRLTYNIRDGSPPPTQPCDRRLTYDIHGPPQLPVDRRLTYGIGPPPPTPVDRRLTYGIGPPPPTPVDRRLTYGIGSPPPTPVDRRLTYGIGSPPPTVTPGDDDWDTSESQHTPQSWQYSGSGSIHSMPSLSDLQTTFSSEGGARALSPAVAGPCVSRSRSSPPLRPLSPLPPELQHIRPRAGQPVVVSPPITPQDLHARLEDVTDRLHRLEDAVDPLMHQPQRGGPNIAAIRQRVVRSQERVNEGIQRLQELITRLNRQNYNR